MGIHRQPKIVHVQPPILDFTIDVHGRPNQVYKPGDLVEGCVSLTPSQHIQPDSILVPLLARSTVDLNIQDRSASIRLLDRAPLLVLTKTITAEPTSTGLEPGHTYDFPFCFRLPVSTREGRDSY